MDRGSTHLVFASSLLAALTHSGCQTTPKYEEESSPQTISEDRFVFYRPRLVGSESLFNPVSSGIHYTMDSLQVDSFSTSHFSENLDLVFDHIGDPDDTIRHNGGYKTFINTEIFPVDADNLGDSQAILPNVALHMFGGGLVFRKNAEWLDAHGYPAPYWTAGLLAAATEIMQEALEKRATDATDEIADIYIFRPLGIWLFIDDDRARWFKDAFNPVDWMYLAMYDASENDVVNIGISYIVRPDWLLDWFLDTKETQPFAYLGITSLFGLSHRVTDQDKFSWGIGASTETVQPTQLRASAGVFYDRDDSLLASLIVHGTDELAVRTNIYPGAILSSQLPLGVFVGVEDDGEVSVGVQWGLPVGLSW